jgi:hypothetical protein
MSTRTIAPYLAVVLAACWTGSTPVQKTVVPKPEVRRVENLQTYEGVLRLEGDNVVIEGDQKKVLQEPGTGVWIMLYGCAVRVHTRNGYIERVESTANDCMYKEVGPIESVRGRLVVETGVPGSKMAGSTLYFDAGGSRYGVIGGTMPAEGQDVTVRLRKLVANMAYAARSTEQDVFFETD